MGEGARDERGDEPDEPGPPLDLDTPLPPGQQGLEDVAWWWIEATADAADPALDDQAANAEDGLTAGLVALACVVVRSVTPDATDRALLTYLHAISVRDLTTEAAALVPEETAPVIHITLQDVTNPDVLAWVEDTMARRYAQIDVA